VGSEGERLFGIWAPTGGIWSSWAKPVLFTCIDRAVATARFPRVDVDWASGPAVVVADLPGAASIEAGVALAGRGFRPVPLFNAAHGPAEVIDQDPLISALVSSAEALSAAPLPPSAPPVFLLDSRRFPRGRTAEPGKLDNRWMVFPQDLPSGKLLLSRGLDRVVVLREAELMHDLAHILRRWQEDGLRIEEQVAGSPGPPRKIDVPRPFRYRHIWYRALAILGLGRYDAGGFGVRVPVPPPPSGGGGFFGGGFH